MPLSIFVYIFIILKRDKKHVCNFSFGKLKALKKGWTYEDFELLKFLVSMFHAYSSCKLLLPVNSL